MVFIAVVSVHFQFISDGVQGRFNFLVFPIGLFFTIDTKLA